MEGLVIFAVQKQSIVTIFYLGTTNQSKFEPIFKFALKKIKKALRPSVIRIQIWH